jgi:hypothetical protein
LSTKRNELQSKATKLLWTFTYWRRKNWANRQRTKSSQRWIK